MPNTAGRLRFVGFGNEVIDFDIITERLEAVGEPLRDVELMPVHARRRGWGPLISLHIPLNSNDINLGWRLSPRCEMAPVCRRPEC